MKSYLKHKIVNLVDIKKLAAVEYLDFEGKYKDYVEKHDFWELCFVEKGKIAFNIEDNHAMLKENGLLLIPPDKEHSYYSPAGNQSRVFVICFQCFSQALRALTEMKFELKSDALACMKRIIAESQATFRMNEKDLLEVIHNPAIGGQQVITLLLEYLLIHLLRLLSSSENSDIVFLNGDNFHRNLVDAVIVFLCDNVSKKLSLDEICKKFSCSKSFLCKIFKEQTGDTLISYFNKLKIEEAKKVLADSDQTIAAISYSLGFQEPKYFDYIFKKHTALSPALYREKLKGEKNHDNNSTWRDQ